MKFGELYAVCFEHEGVYLPYTNKHNDPCVLNNIRSAKQQRTWIRNNLKGEEPVIIKINTGRKVE